MIKWYEIFNSAEGRRQAAEGRKQAAEGRKQAAEGRRQAAEGRRQAAEGREQVEQSPTYCCCVEGEIKCANLHIKFPLKIYTI